MATYKVPQDVEAEDRLLGPFTFRQFIYLMIAVASLAAAWGLFQLFPLLGLIPLPIVILFGVLALPLKKDQPMETYLVAIISFHLKSRKRIWTPGQKESSILITAPKIIEKPRTRNITEEEAGHRLSFLADIIDTEGYAIKNNNTSMREEYAAEASTIVDVLDGQTGSIFDKMIEKEQSQRHTQLVSQMRSVIEGQSTSTINSSAVNSPTINSNQLPPKTDYAIPNYPADHPSANTQQFVSQNYQNSTTPVAFQTQSTQVNQFNTTPFSSYNSTSYPSNPFAPYPSTTSPFQPNINPVPLPIQTPHNQFSPTTFNSPTEQLQNLATNPVYSVETIQREANRIQNQNNNEVFIPLKGA